MILTVVYTESECRARDVVMKRETVSRSTNIRQDGRQARARIAEHVLRALAIILLDVQERLTWKFLTAVQLHFMQNQQVLTRLFGYVIFDTVEYELECMWG